MASTPEPARGRAPITAAALRAARLRRAALLRRSAYVLARADFRARRAELVAARAHARTPTSLAADLTTELAAACALAAASGGALRVGGEEVRIGVAGDGPPLVVALALGPGRSDALVLDLPDPVRGAHDLADVAAVLAAECPRRLRRRHPWLGADAPTCDDRSPT